ncbi:MAG: hypothetical protein Q8859_02685 [Bacteroidota bacterium]|nr:hypothetical protein [Bacteroidota bacterium]
MKKQFFLLTLIFLLSLSYSYAQSSENTWNKWKYLIGEWVGEGNGQPGQGTGKFTFQTELDRNVLVRKSHTEFPASNNRPAFAHDDLLIVYPAISENPAKAIYFDNEGHVLEYTVTYSENSIIMTSSSISNGPRFRLSYTQISDKQVNVKFEFASPQKPDEFKAYLNGNSTKIK